MFQQKSTFRNVERLHLCRDRRGTGTCWGLWKIALQVAPFLVQCSDYEDQMYETL
jgi:hypothetical protein